MPKLKSVAVAGKDARVLRCAHCDLPWGRIQGGVLIIKSRHMGDEHTNVIAIDELMHLVEELRRNGEAPIGESLAGLQDVRFAHPGDVQQSLDAEA